MEHATKEERRKKFIKRPVDIDIDGVVRVIWIIGLVLLAIISFPR